MAKKYTFIRVDRDSVDALKRRLQKINQEDLRKIGVNRGQVSQIDFTKFLFKNPIFISDSELKQLAKKKFGGRIC